MPDDIFTMLDQWEQGGTATAEPSSGDILSQLDAWEAQAPIPEGAVPAMPESEPLRLLKQDIDATGNISYATRATLGKRANKRGSIIQQEEYDTLPVGEVYRAGDGSHRLKGIPGEKPVWQRKDSLGQSFAEGDFRLLSQREPIDRGFLNEILLGGARGVGHIPKSIGGLFQALPEVRRLTTPRMAEQVGEKIFGLPPSQEAQAGDAVAKAVGGWLAEKGNEIVDAPLFAKSDRYRRLTLQNFIDPQFWVAHGAEQIPRLAGMLGLAAATGGGAAPVMVMGGLDAAGSTFDDAYRDRIKKGQSEEDASRGALNEAGVVGIATGLLDRFGVTRILDKTPAKRIFFSALKKRIPRMLAAGAEESVTEGLQEVAEDMAAAGFRDEAITLKGALEKAVIAAGAAGPFGLAGGVRVNVEGGTGATPAGVALPPGAGAVPPTPSATVEGRALLTEEGSAAWVRQNPQAAEKLVDAAEAKEGKLSRADMRDAGIKERWGTDERTKFQQQVRGELDAMAREGALSAEKPVAPVVDEGIARVSREQIDLVGKELESINAEMGALVQRDGEIQAELQAAVEPRRLALRAAVSQTPDEMRNALSAVAAKMRGRIPTANEVKILFNMASKEEARVLIQETFGPELPQGKPAKYRRWMLNKKPIEELRQIARRYGIRKQRGQVATIDMILDAQEQEVLRAEGTGAQEAQGQEGQVRTVPSEAAQVAAETAAPVPESPAAVRGPVVEGPAVAEAPVGEALAQQIGGKKEVLTGNVPIIISSIRDTADLLLYDLTSEKGNVPMYTITFGIPHSAKSISKIKRRDILPLLPSLSENEISGFDKRRTSEVGQAIGGLLAADTIRVGFKSKEAFDRAVHDIAGIPKSWERGAQMMGGLGETAPRKLSALEDSPSPGKVQPERGEAATGDVITYKLGSMKKPRRGRVMSVEPDGRLMVMPEDAKALEMIPVKPEQIQQVEKKPIGGGKTDDASLVAAFTSGLPARESPSNLANPGRTERAEEFIEAVTTRRESAGFPTPRPRAVAEAEAGNRLAADYEGEKQRLIGMMHTNTPYNDADVAAAKDIINRELAKDIEYGDEKALAERIKMVWAYRDTGTATARGLAMRAEGRGGKGAGVVNAPGETVESHATRNLLEAVIEPPKTVRKEYDKLMAAGDVKGADAILIDWAGKIKGKMAEIGLSDKAGVLNGQIRTLYLTDTNKYGRLLADIQASKADNWDALYEYWQQAILSAPTTHIVNFGGTAANGLWHFSGRRMLSGLINLVTRDPNGVQLGEMKHVWAGMMPGISRGAANFLKAWRSELPAFDMEVGGPLVQRQEERGRAIGGAKGRAVRAFGWRPLQAVDALTKSIAAQMEVGGQAYRIAKREGLSGDALSKRMNELTRDYSSEAWREAIDTATRLSFQDEGTGLWKKAETLALRARADVPGVRYAIPFVRTTMSIFRQGLRMTPMGWPNLVKQAMIGRRTGSWAGFGEAAADQLAMFAVTAALLGTNDPEDPWITGARQELTREGKIVSQRTFPAQSIKIGGRWFSYARVEPLATALSFLVDMTDAIRSGNVEEMSKTIPANIMAQITNKTFLNAIGDIFEVVQKHDTESVVKWAGNFATSWVPNIARSALRSGDEAYMERGVWGKGDERWARIFRRIGQKTELPLPELLVGGDRPAVDVWGRDAVRSFEDAPASAFLYNVLVPARTKDDDAVIADRVIAKWNWQNPDEVYQGPLPPGKDYRVQGKKYYMTDEQYEEYSSLAGSIARQRVERAKFNEEAPTARDIKIIKTILSESREAARKRLIPKWWQERKALTPAR